MEKNRPEVYVLQADSVLLTVFTLQKQTMAEIHLPTAGHRKSGVRRSKKLSTRIDLTPMVDLGFLLITFFLLTTTLAKPRAMAIAMPYKGPLEAPPTTWKKGQTMTLLLSDHHRIYYYDGFDDHPALRQTSFVQQGVRQVIIDKIKRVKALQAAGVLRPANEAAFLVKPDTGSTFEDFVQIMDELSICNVNMKAMVDITPADRELIAGMKR